jgi:hypothetical protein
MAGAQLWRTAYNEGYGPPQSPDEEADFLALQGIKWRTATRSAAGWVPPSVLDDLAHAIGGPALERAKAYLCCLVALDRACDGLNLCNPRVVPEIEPLILRALESGDGRLTLHSPAKVLRKASIRRSGGAALAHYLRNFAPLDAVSVTAYDVKASPLPEASRLAHAPRAAAERSVRVAFVPTLDELNDASIEPVERELSRRFAVRLDPRKQARFSGKCADLVDRLEAEGVELALFPETALAPGAVGVLRAALIKNFSSTLGRPALRLVLAGRLDEDARENAVVALSGAGETLAVQRKQQPWRLDARQQDRYGLSSVLGDVKGGIDRDEDIKLHPPAMHVLDDGGFGRIVILICEDLARCEPARRIAVDLTPSHVVGPVMDASLARHRWAGKASDELAAEPGAVVLVVNSSVLSLKEQSTSGKPLPLQPGIGLVTHPEYAVHSKFPEGGLVRHPPVPFTFAVVDVPYP